MRAKPGYISLYSYVSPATAAFRFASVLPIGSPVAGSPVSLRKSLCLNAWPVSDSEMSRKSRPTLGVASMSAQRAN